MSKTILITGTSSGFGKLMTTTLAKEGHQVIATMRNVKNKNSEVADKLNALDNVEVVEMDVTSEESIANAIAYAIEKYEQIDVLINNAGTMGFGVIEATSPDQIKNIMDVDLFGPVRTYQAILPSMRARKAGLIINISSGFGLTAVPFVVPYNMSKFALEALTEGIRHEIKDFGIETVTVLPGPYPTEIITKEGFGPDRPEIVESYGAATKEKLQKFNDIMKEDMEKFKSDPQEIADAVSKIVNMEDGTRPFQTVVNRITEGVEQEYADSKLTYKAAIMKKFGWEAF